MRELRTNHPHQKRRADTMAKKPASRKSTADNPPASSTRTDKTDISPLKCASCSNLLGTATIHYEIAANETEGIRIRLSDYEGNGYYCKAWVSLASILSSLEAFAAKYPLVSLALKDVYPPSTSCNSWSFLMAVLLAEGLVERLEDNKRHYRLCDPADFLASLPKPNSVHSGPAKGKPRARAKAATRMQKSKAKPATGE